MAVIAQRFNAGFIANKSSKSMRTKEKSYRPYRDFPEKREMFPSAKALGYRRIAKVPVRSALGRIHPVASSDRLRSTCESLPYSLRP
jgi:hypothetical protein